MWQNATVKLGRPPYIIGDVLAKMMSDFHDDLLKIAGKGATVKTKSTKTPVRVMQVPKAADVAAAARSGGPIPMAAPMQDPPFKMVRGRPGSDEALSAAKLALMDAGMVVRSINHTPAGDVLAYVMDPDDAPAPPKPRSPRSSIPRKVR